MGALNGKKYMKMCMFLCFCVNFKHESTCFHVNLPISAYHYIILVKVYIHCIKNKLHSITYFDHITLQNAIFLNSR